MFTALLKPLLTLTVYIHLGTGVYSMAGPYAAQAVRVPHYKNVNIGGTLRLVSSK